MLRKEGNVGGDRGGNWGWKFLSGRHFARPVLCGRCFSRPVLCVAGFAARPGGQGPASARADSRKLDKYIWPTSGRTQDDGSQ